MGALITVFGRLFVFFYTKIRGPTKTQGMQKKNKGKSREVYCLHNFSANSQPPPLLLLLLLLLAAACCCIRAGTRRTNTERAL
jgi:hypothetical protein